MDESESSLVQIATTYSVTHSNVLKVRFKLVKRLGSVLIKQ